MKKVLDDAGIGNEKKSANITSPTNVSFSGYNEDRVALCKKVINVHTGLSAGIAAALAQTPGGDEVALAANDALMVINIGSKYGMTFDKKTASVVVSKYLTHAGAVKAFSKVITWFPGLGNAANAAVGAGATKALGHSFLTYCEICEKSGNPIDPQNYNP